ncbi:MAG: PQQ-dependent sugar dehydrogenase [Saprospiraceae bacterium]|nr:PQQ-dependent sugar dehydrogenase [Saprospiraceae bacterium]MDP4998561.1 PQQ-dependent sugar dehydrogenase [Saprospiraceae bacterium]
MIRKHFLPGGLFVLALALAGCGGNTDKADAAQTALPEPEDTGIAVPEGFYAQIVADTVGRARHLTVRDNGDVYVMLDKPNKEGGIAGLRDTNGDGKADEMVYFGAHTGTGIEIYQGYLYYASDTSIHRYRLDDTSLKPLGEAEQIVGGLPIQGTYHAAKPFDFDGAGNLYVNVGAPSNACQEKDREKDSQGMDPCPLLEKQGGIWQFKADVPGQTQDKDGKRYASGIRNAVALNWNTAANALYALQHGRDQLNFLYPELYTEQQSAELPAEEFLKVTEGADFGWPYCYFDQLQNKKVLGPEYGGDGKIQERCADKDQPILAFPGHYAPNDLIFYRGDQFPEQYKNGAFIAFHGSWNRTPLTQQGYHVVFVPFKGDQPSGDWRVFADDFAGVDPVVSSREVLHRPCGLAEGPDGSLYVADSKGGRIYRIFYKGIR